MSRRPVKRRVSRVRAAVLVVVLAASSAACSADRRSGRAQPSVPNGSPGCRGPAATGRPHPDLASKARAVEVMQAFAVRAWNPAAPPVRPSTIRGGLYVNFRGGWSGTADPSANTNIRTSGRTDAESAAVPRHDPLTDLILLRDLDALAAVGVDGGALRVLRCRLQSVTQAEFVDYGPPRGWIYFQLMDLARLDSRGPWSVDARRYAASLARRYAAGLPRGQTFRPDWVAQSAAALVDAGTRFARAAWVSTGNALAAQLVATSANPVTGLFPGQLVMQADGSVAVRDDLVKAGALGQLLDGLLTVAMRTGSAQLLAAVRRGLAALSDRNIALHDPVNGGWFYAVSADGTGVRTAYKETRQAWLTPLFRDAARAGLAAPAEAADMTAVVRDRLYQADVDGYEYRVRADWSTFTTSNKGMFTRENWVSSEATGIAVDVLLGPIA